MLASALAALGGALLGPLFLVFPQMGELPLLKALTAIVLGGMGSVPGAVDRRPGHRHHRGGLDAVHPDRLIATSWCSACWSLALLVRP